MADNAWKLGGLTLPNPIVMVENMLSDGALVHNDNHASDNFGSIKSNIGTLKDRWAFLGGDGYMGDITESITNGTNKDVTKTTASKAKDASDHADMDMEQDNDATTGASATTSTATGGGAMIQAKRGVAEKKSSKYHSMGQSPSQSPTQSPTQSPIQSPMQVPVTQAKKKCKKPETKPEEPVEKPAPKVKKGLKNPLAIPIGIADGLIDFVTHCVGAHVDFLWKDPGKILRDPLGAIRLNQLEINPLGHIFKSIEQANQRDNPFEQLFEIPMGLEELPGIKNTAMGKKAAEQTAKEHKH